MVRLQITVLLVVDTCNDKVVGCVIVETLLRLTVNIQRSLLYNTED
jgi:hypothetical protein